MSVGVSPLLLVKSKAVSLPGFSRRNVKTRPKQYLAEKCRRVSLGIGSVNEKMTKNY